MRLAGAGLGATLADTAGAVGAALPFAMAGLAAAAPLAGRRPTGEVHRFMPSLAAAGPTGFALPRAPVVAVRLLLLSGGMSALSCASVRKPPLGTYLRESTVRLCPQVLGDTAGTANNQLGIVTDHGKQEAGSHFFSRLNS